MKLNILKFQAINLPESLIGIVNGNIFKLNILHLTEELGAVYYTILHKEIIGIPYSRARTWSKITTLYTCTINMPPGIFSIKLTIITLHALALLNARFSINNRNTLQPQVVGSKQRPLASKLLILNQFHCFCLYFRLQRYNKKSVIRLPRLRILIPI